ncbi:uncharacterized protein PGTG_08620 [Puccinia graminis f. sp. tritici CRL 75-36-700-3]|uniref:Uncharacterized protein n=1 Tax=Puccinia graminis f. sp. tritici (strain CRL 75-36-700-3 / race SCCL) TaxID=418459 RepID=E3KGK9_PUCGT|nr:uncharacterized protein PGTG_08620 [Puccinia graminis f. sp. tritici CRL 75-36-700-3]EFP83434.1 hypothetical protein PGTG_08620 [Puccinia graminis f. sp. tritici CRL 75-36-700-3]
MSSTDLPSLGLRRGDTGDAMKTEGFIKPALFKLVIEIRKPHSYTARMHFYKSIVLFLLTAMVENIVASGPPPPPSSSGNGVQPRTDQVCQKVGGAQYCMTGVEQGRDKTQLIEEPDR